MKRFMTTLLGAGLAILLASSAQAELFTVERTATPSTVSVSNGSSVGAVVFNMATSQFPANPPYWDSEDPGASAILLNYAVTYTGTDVVTFTNQTFALDVLFRSQGPANVNAVQMVHWNGTINGTVGPTSNGGVQNGLIVDLQPHEQDFMLGTVPFKLFDFKPSGRPGVSDPNSDPRTWDTAAIGVIAISPNAIPEPGSMALLAMGGLPFLGMIRRRRK